MPDFVFGNRPSMLIATNSRGPFWWEQAKLVLSLIEAAVPCARLEVTHSGVYIIPLIGPVEVLAYRVVLSTFARVSCQQETVA